MKPVEKRRSALQDHLAFLIQTGEDFAHRSIWQPGLDGNFAEALFLAAARGLDIGVFPVVVDRMISAIRAANLDPIEALRYALAGLPGEPFAATASRVVSQITTASATPDML